MNRPDNRFTTLSAAVEALQQQGYSDELICMDKGLFNHERELVPERFTIDSCHRIERSTDPADMCIVYAVSSPEYGLKGLLISAYGTYASACVERMVLAVPDNIGDGTDPAPSLRWPGQANESMNVADPGNIRPDPRIR